MEKNNSNKNERQSLKLDVLERRQVFLFGWTMTMIRDTHTRHGTLPTTGNAIFFPSSNQPVSTFSFFLSLAKIFPSIQVNEFPKKVASQNFNFTIRICVVLLLPTGEIGNRQGWASTTPPVGVTRCDKSNAPKKERN